MTYKSKYYDPKKRHEYYMRTRKLKGRKKKSSMQLVDNRESDIRERIKSERKAEYAKVTKATTYYISRLRKTWKQMGWDKERIKEEAEKVRSRAKASKQRIREKYKAKLEKELAAL